MLDFDRSPRRRSSARLAALFAWSTRFASAAIFTGLSAAAQVQSGHALEGGASLAWSVQRDGPVPYEERPGGVVTGNGRVYTAAIGYAQAGQFVLVTARDAATGALVWSAEASVGEASVVAADVLLTPDGARLFVIAGVGPWSGDYFSRVLAFDVLSGAQQLAFDYAGANGEDVELHDAAFDASGRTLYACGLRALTLADSSMLTVAFDASSGAVQWERSYEGVDGEAWESGSALAVDPVHAFVMVTGSSPGAFTGRDYVTIAYTPGGARQWIARHAGAGNSNDVPMAIAVSPDGEHVVVSGDMQDGDETVGYSSLTGSVEWTATAAASAQEDSDGLHVAFAPDSNAVYVACHVEPQGSWWRDLRVAAFGSASGALQWSSDYASPALGWSGDKPVAMIVAPSGARVYALSASQFGYSALYPVAIAFDAAQGAVVWTDVGWPTSVHTDVPTSLALSADGASVYFATVRTLPWTAAVGSMPQTHVRALAAGTGGALWIADSPHESVHGNDDARAVVVAPNGTQAIAAVSTAASGGTFLYLYAFATANGAEQWSLREWTTITTGSSAARLAYSADGAVLYSARQQNTMTLVQARDAATGTQIWSALLPQTHYAFYGPTLDLGVAPGSGRVCVSTGFNSYVVHALDPTNGSSVWTSEYTAPWGGIYGPRALAFRPDGTQIYVTGAVLPGTLALVDKVTVAFDMAGGTQLWAAGAQVPGEELGVDVVVSPDGARVISAGQDSSLPAPAPSSIDAYDASHGAPLWSVTWNPQFGADTRVVQLACGADAVYALANGSSTAGAGLRLAAFDLATGAPRWEVFTSGSVAKDGAVLALESDGTTLFVTGTASITSDEAVALAYDATSGTLLWQASYGTGSGPSLGKALALSADGHELYVASTSSTDVDKGDLVLDRYAVPTLAALPEHISVLQGGTQTYSLRADGPFAGDYHVLGGSLSGMAPGFALGVLQVPLNLDAYTFASISQGSPVAGGIGVLDAQGLSTASLHVAPGALSTLVGLVAHHAFVAIDSQSGSAAFASNPVRLELVH
jgi:sugar lactone lactonase YvrE